MVEEANYATLKNLTDEDLELMEEEEDSHYALVRQPDGKADEPEYSSLRYDTLSKCFCLLKIHSFQNYTMAEFTWYLTRP